MKTEPKYEEIHFSELLAWLRSGLVETTAFGHLPNAKKNAVPRLMNGLQYPMRLAVESSMERVPEDQWPELDPRHHPSCELYRARLVILPHDVAQRLGQKLSPMSDRLGGVKVTR